MGCLFHLENMYYSSSKNWILIQFEATLLRDSSVKVQLLGTTMVRRCSGVSSDSSHGARAGAASSAPLCWPKENFVLIQPTTGCPDSHWGTGSVTDTMHRNSSFPPGNLVSGTIDGSSVTINYCAHSADQACSGPAAPAHFPPGTYCVHQYEKVISLWFTVCKIFTWKKFLPESHNFLKFFLRIDLKWFFYLLIFAKFGFQFFLLNPVKNVKFKWIRLTIRKSVLAQTRDPFTAHTPDDWLFDWLNGLLEHQSKKCVYLKKWRFWRFHSVMSIHRELNFS